MFPDFLPVRPDGGPGAGKVEGEVGAAPAEPVRPAALVALPRPAHGLRDDGLVVRALDRHHVVGVGRLVATAAAASTPGAAGAAAAAAAAPGHGQPVAVCSCHRLGVDATANRGSWITEADRVPLYFDV